ncbi:hypothetical protein [Paractinoplanes durhamensis]|uniref:Secreted protein n=1 Tax=Paractinoplanes durhamensis TaxID=113563 RepID=A0ABQ3YYI9_9ACTN|nr:hypothetical protein [Actinoplanes durhamensis]GIE02369.1 hypothetical protein Adu01nite_37190 [Actinoplanes durhamensis]
MTIHFRPVRVALAVVVAVTAVFSGVPAANAALAATTVSALTRVNAISATNSFDNKGVAANCPVGQRIVGGSAIAFGEPGVFVRVTGPIIGINGQDQGTIVYGAEEDETRSAGNWALTITAICAVTPPGYELIISPFAGENSASSREATATCSPGKQMLGGFGDVSTGNFNVILDDIQPSLNLNSVTVRAFEDETGAANTWFVTAFAVCANPVAGLSVQFNSSETASPPAQLATQVFCPAGTRALSGGGTINSGFGQVDSASLFVSGDHVNFSSAEDRNGYASNWSRTAYAVCAT